MFKKFPLSPFCKKKCFLKIYVCIYLQHMQEQIDISYLCMYLISLEIQTLTATTLGVRFLVVVVDNLLCLCLCKSVCIVVYKTFFMYFFLAVCRLGKSQCLGPYMDTGAQYSYPIRA